jgi:MFS family permease
VPVALVAVRDSVNLQRIPQGVVALGLVSLFMDLSSEMIHGLLPFFLVNVLKTSAFTFGVIEGVAEATTAVTKLFSGVVSDWWGRRKPLLLVGYGLAALVRPVFPLEVFGARLIDRVGKGIRGAPRDALVADITPPDRRGAAYGLRQSMDSVGAFGGPLIALGLMLAFGNDVRLVFWIAAVPAVVAVLIIALMIHEPSTHQGEHRPFPIHRSQLRALPMHYWLVVGLAGVFTLARFSEGFLLLRAAEKGLSPALVPGVLVLMNLVYLLSAYPLGQLADRYDRRLLLAAGIGVLVLADIMLAWANSVRLVLAGAMVWGLHMGATQGLLAALVADAAPARLRGTAFGVFNLVNGLALLGASIIAGGLWASIGPNATFVAGAAFAVVSGCGLLAAARWPRKPVPS